IRYLLPDSARWASYSAQILQRLHARPANEDDVRTFEIVVTALVISSDTLVGRFNVGDRQKCPGGSLIVRGTVHETRAQRTVNGWVAMYTHAIGVGDTRRCRS